MSYQLADGTTTVQFVRPAHRLVALHGAQVVPVAALGCRRGARPSVIASTPADRWQSVTPTTTPGSSKSRAR